MRKHHAARYPFLWCMALAGEDHIIRAERKKAPEEVNFYRWDICDGFQKLVQANGKGPWIWEMIETKPTKNPAEAIKGVQGLDENSIVFMMDFHKFFKDVTVCRQALNVKEHLKGNAKTVVFMSPNQDIPLELNNDITTVEFPMPGKDELAKVLTTVAGDNEIVVPENPEAIIEAMRGLTEEAAENALCKSLVEKKAFDHVTVLDEKAAMLKASGVLSYMKYAETFKDLFGLEFMKEWVKITINSPLARMICIYGIPGCGKSAFAKAVAYEMNRACLAANFAAIRGKYQGDAESRIALMLSTAEAFGNPIIFADEFEKSIAGSEASQVEGGVGQRIVGSFLTYTEDRPPGGPYWIMTCNNLDDILNLSGGALVRRFDCIFFVDMPSLKEARGIAKIWSRKMGVEIPEDFDFGDSGNNKVGYSGADIRKLATNMAMMECSADKAAKFLIPSSQSIGSRIEKIREKAANVCIPASRNGQAKVSAQSQRKVDWD